MTEPVYLASPALAGKFLITVPLRKESGGCSRAAAPVCGISRGTTARSVSLSWGAREVGLHASGEGERVIAPEPWEGTLASRRVEEGLSRSFPG